MLLERTWRKRVILNFVILFVWMLIFSAILSFTSRNAEISSGVQSVLAAGLIILVYFISIKRIVKLDWNLNKRQLSAMKLLLWLIYPFLAISILSVFQLQRIDFFISSSDTLITGIGVYGTILLMISLGVLFNRWRMAFNTLKQELS